MTLLFDRMDVCMQENCSNTLSFFNADGTRVCRTFQEVRQDALKYIEKMRGAGFATGRNAHCVIMGPPGYAWVTACVACIFTGTTIVALPETLNDEDAMLALSGIEPDGAIVGLENWQFRFVQQVPRILLQDLSDEALDADGACPNTSRLEMIAFTSGSVAERKLKSFRINGDSTAWFFRNFVELYGITPVDTWAVLHTFSHIVHLEYVLGALLFGYNVALADPLALIRWGRTISPAVIVTVPAIYRLIARQIRASSERCDGDEGRKSSAQIAKDTLGENLKVAIIGAAPSEHELKAFLIACGIPLYEAYGTSEVGMISCNTPDYQRAGTVGKAFPGVHLELGSDGEILVGTSFRRADEYVVQEGDARLPIVHDDGLVRTGDLGELTADGYLRVIGRKKELIVTDAGKKIHPTIIEGKLLEISCAEHAVAFEEHDRSLTAVVSLQEDVLNSDVSSLGDRWLTDLNRSLASYEFVSRLLVIPKAFSTENGLLTRSGKPIRRAICERFRQPR